MAQSATVPVPADGRPGAPPSPGARVGRAWTVRFAVASTGMWLAFLTPAQIQLARQSELFAPDSKEALLGLATGLGAAVTAAAVPAFGALSDRTRSRFGRRRPWVAVGCLLAAVGFVMLAAAGGVAGMLSGWLVAQLGLASVQAGLYATIPDQVPRPQLGVVAGWAGMTQMLGALLGTVLANQLFPGLSAGYLAIAAVLACALVPFLLGHRDTADADGAGTAAGTPVGAGARAEVSRATAGGEPGAAADRAARRRAGWDRLRRSPDVRWAWLSRFLVVLGFALVTQYLLYYLTDELRRPDPQQSVMTVTAITVLCAMAAAVTTGRWSDRIGRRRAFVATGGALMGAGALLLAVLPAWPVVPVAAVLIGVGFGTFLAVDLAVIASVLPSAADTGRDLGIFAVATAAPQILGPALAVPVLAVSGYTGLYVLTAAVCVLGGAAVLKVRAVP